MYQLFNMTDIRGDKRVLFLFGWTVCALILSCSIALATEGISVQPAALEYTGAYAVRQADPILTGQGVVIAAVCRSITYVDGQPQNDYQWNLVHNCFGDRQVVFTDGTSGPGGISEHATAIGGILVGNDIAGWHESLGEFRYEGAVPEAMVDVYEFWHFIRDYVFGTNPVEADVITMSVGTQFESWWTNGLGLLADIEGVPIIASIGNGTNAYDTVLYPAAGANIIGVGVVDSVVSNQLDESLSRFWLVQSEHSSYGPTTDERFKPDITAPGNCLVPDANSTNGYRVSGDWSSFATPVVTGTVGLLIQKAKTDEQFSLAIDRQGGNCVIKAILMNSAIKLPYWHKGKFTTEDDHTAVLDYLQGAGIVNSLGAYEQLISGRKTFGQSALAGWDNEVVNDDQDSANVYAIEINEPGGKVITATLVWNRHYENIYPFKPAGQMSDLRLELWAIDKENPQNNFLLDYSDSVNNNVEHIYCQTDPNYQLYEIVVRYSRPAQQEQPISERYAIAWNTSNADTKEDYQWYDLNGDGQIDYLDVSISMSNFGKQINDNEFYMPGDINMNGTVDIDDLSDLMKQVNSRSQ